MQDIFDSSKMIGKRLGVRKIVALSVIENDRALHYIRRDMAMMLSDMVIQDSDFFKANPKNEAGICYVEYSADVVVLTADEYASLKRESFKQGVDHAFYFMPAVRNPA
jgi:predicted hydrocarbon binding protein